MLIGPVFTREVVSAPRRIRLYVTRAVYAAFLLVLASTAWQMLTGAQIVRNIGDLARFGSLVFQVLAPLELVLAAFLAALSAAIAVSQEKDRRTLVLLLLTRLSHSELVLGKLLASLLNVLSLVVTALPVFMLLSLLGGISFAQVGRTAAVTFASVLACGSLGSTLAMWREKTFQTLALTTLVLVFWTASWELVARGTFGHEWLGVPHATWAAAASPWHAIMVAARPGIDLADTAWSVDAVPLFILVAAGLVLLLNGVAVMRVRAWNSSYEGTKPDKNPSTDSLPAPLTPPLAIASRPVWSNPILWREVRTWAYGRRVLLLRLAYLLLFALAATLLYNLDRDRLQLSRADVALPLAPLFLVSLLLVNAQAVTSVTGERDLQALDLLLVTDLTPKEIVYGKLAGVLYNTKEMIVLPAALCAYLWYLGAASLENTAYLLCGWLVLCVFAAVLGIHAAITYANSRLAIGVSLGTLFFLFVGVATSMRIMVAFSGSFEFQLQPFLAAMVGGSVALYAALGARNPSLAILAAALVCPVATFYALTSFLLDYPLAMFLAVTCTYGFATAAMLIPAVHDFDVATGRTGGLEEE